MADEGMAGNQKKSYKMRDKYSMDYSKMSGLLGVLLLTTVCANGDVVTVRDSGVRCDEA